MKSKKHKAAIRKTQKAKKTLEESYRQVFLSNQPSPARERLSMYKSVPSVTTYGLCEKPA